MNNFLTKLKNEKKLQIVGRSQEICESYILKSENCLKSAKILLEELIYENSIIDSYYAMYNLVLALFFRCGIKCENHTGSIIILKEIFGAPQLAKTLEEAKKSRIDSQYYVSDAKQADSKAAEDAARITENFILELRLFMDAMSEDGIEKIRNRFS